MSIFYNLSIKKIIKETPEAISIIFDVPLKLKKKFSFMAGQYVTLKKQFKEKEVRRAYSICVSPNSNELKIAIKSLKNGLFSVYANSKLKEKDVLEVSKPEGKFTLIPHSNKNYIAFAAGSGITPILSMVKTVLENKSSSTFTLIYGNKNEKNTIFKQELDSLKQTYPKNFNLHYVFSKEQQHSSLFGRIDKGITNYFLKNKYKKTEFHSVFLCGPQQMIDTVSNTFQENKFPKENIHFELFSCSIKNKNTTEIKQGQTKATILLDNEQVCFTIKQTDTILTSVLKNNLDAPYSCQGGICASCIAKVTEGEASMSKNQILTDDEVETGLVLTCCAYPTSTKITVDYDDV